MTTTEDSLVASMLLAVSMSSEESSRCALAEFAQDLRLRLGEDKGASMTDVLADRCLDLVKEEERITAVKDSVLITYDKLCAEVNRIEAQLKEQERQLQQVAQQKKMYRLAVNLLVAGAAPRLVEVADVGSPSAMSEGVPRQSNIGGPRDDFLSEPLTSVAPPTGPKDQRQTELASAAAPPTSTKVAHTSAIAEDHAQSNGMNSSPMSLLTMLRIPDVKESALLQALKAYESDLVEKAYAWLTNSEHLDIFLAIAKHLPEPRPPIQLLELQILGLLFQVNLPPSSPHGKNVQPLLESLITKGNVVPILVKLLNSVNDDIKCEVLESLAPLVSMTHPSLGTNNGMGRSCRQQFLAAGGLDPLIGIVACSTSEAVLERALVLLWGILSKDDKDDAEHNGGRTVRAAVHELGGLRAVLDLLYTDSLAILENVSMVIGYITRDDEAKVEIREIGGLEKVTATLRHPSDSIQTKMAGIVWNCSSNADNRQYLRQLGAIPALLELLQSPEDVRADRGNDYVRENAAGALWNLSVDAENKTQIMEYGGVGSLLQTISRTTSEFVVENVTGTLWNCSAAPEARPLLRKAGGIPILLSFLQTEDASGKQRPARFSNEKALDNICGILRNCSISDQNKPVIREAGGVELILKRIVERLRSRTTEHSLPLSASAVDKLASTLWILTISPDIKHTVRHAKGIELITSLLWDSSPSIAARLKKRSDFASIFDGLGRPTSGDDALEMMMRQVPFATPSLFMNMSTKEKLAGVLRNCTTIQESRPLLLQTKAVQCLVSLIADCFYSETVFPTRVSNSKSGSQLGSPSLQLRETVASALWYLSRDDKVVPREQGGLQLLCLLVTTPRQPAVVMEQAAGALSSLTVNNAENRTAVRQWGGLLSLVRFVSDRAMTEYPQRSRNQPSSKAPQDNLNASNTFAIVNALLTIRNGTVSCDPNLQLCCSIALDLKSRFVEALVHVLRNAPEECAREAALTIKNLCGASRDVVRLFASREVPSHLKGLLERSSTETVRRAAVLTLEVFTKER